MNISKKMLAESIYKQFDNVPKYKILKIIDLLFIDMKSELIRGNNITIRNFGTFKFVHKKERKIIHPVTRQIIKMPEHNDVKFVQSKILKESNM